MAAVSAVKVHEKLMDRRELPGLAALALCSVLAATGRERGAAAGDQPTRGQSTADGYVQQLPPAQNQPPIILPLMHRMRTGADDESLDRPPLTVDRQIERQLEMAADAISKKDFPEAIHQLQRVLDHAEDSWIGVSGNGATRFVSARQQAMDRIGRMPLAARQSYETEFGQIAPSHVGRRHCPGKSDRARGSGAPVLPHPGGLSGGRPIGKPPAG